MRAILVLVISAALAGCGLLSTALPQRYGPPQERLYVPRYAKFEFQLNGKNRISHEYLYGAGVQSCNYVGKRAATYFEDGQAMYPYQSSKMADFEERGGHVYQGAVLMDREVLGMRMVSPLTAHYNPQTKKLEGGTAYLDFQSFCSDRLGSHTYNVSLRKSSAQTIDEGIQHRIWMLENVWKHLARWEAPVEVRRGANRWIVFKTWNKADYLTDAAEEWSLPIGDSGYYFRVIFGYKSADIVDNAVDYAKSRAVLDHILDSFVIEPL